MSNEFVLRCSTEEIDNGRTIHKNQQVATFIDAGDGVYVTHFSPSSLQAIYQIYPGNANQTFYSLDKGELIVVYCILNERRACFCASHNEKDHYIYFHAIPKTTDIVVIKTTSLKRAEQLLQNKTQFTL